MLEIASLIVAALHDLEFEADLIRDGLPALEDDARPPSALGLAMDVGLDDEPR